LPERNHKGGEGNYDSRYRGDRFWTGSHHLTLGLPVVLFFADERASDLFFVGLGSGVAFRIFRKASSNECGASVKGLPCFPAGFGFVLFAISNSLERLRQNKMSLVVSFAARDIP